MKDIKVVIIGAGPAGLACAYELSKNGVQVEVYEASSKVGGMSRTIDLWGQKVDLGPHRFFSKNPALNNFFKELIKEDYVLINRLTRIFYKKRFFFYPLKIFNVLGNLNLLTVIRILWDYLVQKVSPRKESISFEDWVVSRFGTKLFSIFFKNYSEKLWGIPCANIDAEWAAQRIKKLSLAEAIKSAFFFRKKGKHATLVDQFAYPKFGTGLIYDRAAESIVDFGGKIFLETRIKRVLIEKGNTQGIVLEDERIVEADFVVSTMPLNYLVMGLPSISEKVKNAVKKLYFRNTILVYVEIESTNLFKDNWIYVHSPEVKLGRVTNFRNWSPSLYGDKDTSILCCEYWAFDRDLLWNEKDSLLGELAIKELRKLKLIPNENIATRTFVERIPNCYPVYEIGYRKNLEIVESFIDQVSGLLPIGRYGSFKYNNQDHSILMGLLSAKKILRKQDIDLWDINADDEYHEMGKLDEILISDARNT